MSGTRDFITDKMKSKNRGDLARAAVAAYGAAAWGKDRVIAVLEWCGLPAGVIQKELDRRTDQRAANRKNRNETARLRRIEAKEQKAAANAAK